MKNVILGHKRELDELLTRDFVPREGVEHARKNLENNLIKVIVGPRRAGKSVFALQILRGVKFAYVNFDDERLVGLSDYDDILKAIIQVYGEVNYLFFKAGDELNCDNLIILTWDHDGEETVNGKKIRFMPLWVWLTPTRS